MNVQHRMSDLNPELDICRVCKLLGDAKQIRMTAKIKTFEYEH